VAHRSARKPAGPRERVVCRIRDASAERPRSATRISPADGPEANYAFDVTPARLVTPFITERGVCPASRKGLLELFPERGRRVAAE
jgi:methylthioribose-1-phosphate isomerase